MKATLLILLWGFSHTLFSQFSNEEQLKERFFEIFDVHMLDVPEDAELSFAMVNPSNTLFMGLKQTADGFEHIKNDTTLFEIGQMTNIFTTALLAHYVLDGSLSLDDVVKNKISIELKPKFTFRQLANHHSGLDRGPTNQMSGKWSSKNPWAMYNEQKLREYLDSKFKLVSKPGLEYHESFTGMALLGFSLRRMEQISYEELIQKNLLDKYGMNNSTYDLKSVEEIHAAPYNGLGEIGEHWTFQPSISAIAGLRSSVADLSKFMQAHFNSENKDLLMGTKPSKRINSTTEIGLGWKIRSDMASHSLLFIKGRTGGFSSCMIIDLEKKMGFVLLSNQVLTETAKALEAIVKTQIK
jgi:CubicO group peptidase (beta-lactamase class C family)